MKLPNLYTSKFDKKIDNSMDYVKLNDQKPNNLSKMEIKKKIDNIFQSPNYIYKIKVKIILKDKTLEKYLIGISKNNLITIDNEMINVNDIVDIYETNK